MEADVKLIIDGYLKEANDLFNVQKFMEVREKLLIAWEYLPNTKVE